VNLHSNRLDMTTHLM